MRRSCALAASILLVLAPGPGAYQAAAQVLTSPAQVRPLSPLAPPVADPASVSETTTLELARPDVAVEARALSADIPASVATDNGVPAALSGQAPQLRVMPFAEPRLQAERNAPAETNAAGQAKVHEIGVVAPKAPIHEGEDGAVEVQERFQEGAGAVQAVAKDERVRSVVAVSKGSGASHDVLEDKRSVDGLFAEGAGGAAIPAVAGGTAGLERSFLSAPIPDRMPAAVFAAAAVPAALPMAAHDGFFEVTPAGVFLAIAVAVTFVIAKLFFRPDKPKSVAAAPEASSEPLVTDIMTKETYERAQRRTEEEAAGMLLEEMAEPAPEPSAQPQAKDPLAEAIRPAPPSVVDERLTAEKPAPPAYSPLGDPMERPWTEEEILDRIVKPEYRDTHGQRPPAAKKAGSSSPIMDAGERAFMAILALLLSSAIITLVAAPGLFEKLMPAGNVWILRMFVGWLFLPAAILWSIWSLVTLFGPTRKPPKS